MSKVFIKTARLDLEVFLVCKFMQVNPFKLDKYELQSQPLYFLFPFFALNCMVFYHTVRDKSENLSQNLLGLP